MPYLRSEADFRYFHSLELRIRSLGLFLKNLAFFFQPTYRTVLLSWAIIISESSNSSLQIETLKNLVEGNRKTKLESGLHVDRTGNCISMRDSHDGTVEH